MKQVARLFAYALIVWSIAFMAVRSPLACTIFMASRNGRTLVGNNEDWRDPGTHIWVVPASKGKYARLYFGFGVGLAQGGVNEKGLFFDFAAVSPKPFVGSPGKQVYPGYLVEKLMEECGTVEEALALFSVYDFPVLSRAQLMLVDRTGDSAVVESGGIFRKRGDFQVISNFRQSEKQAHPPGLERFEIAEGMLKDQEVSVELFRAALNATHQEGSSPTQYSTVFDLTSGDIYLYHFHNYLDVARLNLGKELGKGQHDFEIRSLFPRVPFAAAQYAVQNARKERVATTVDPTVFKELIGDYELGPGTTLRISTSEDGKSLQAQISGLPVFLIYAEEGLKFFCRAMDMQISFKRRADLGVDSLVMTFAGQDSTAKRIQPAN